MTRKHAVWLLLPALVALLGSGFYLASRDSDPPPATTADSAAIPSAGEALGFVFAVPPRPLPNLGFVDGDGRPLGLAEFRGRVVLLNIWATWCLPCLKEMPSLDRLQARIGGPDFLVLPLSIDIDGLEAVKAFYRDLELNALGVFVDESGEAANALNTIGVPTTLLLDREGRELARKVGIAEWDSAAMIAFLQRYLNTLSDPGNQPSDQETQ